jgi:VanZ family protein
MRPITGIKILGIRLGVIALAVYWLSLFLGTHWPSGVQVASAMNDKTKHFAGFFGLAMLCCYVTNASTGDRIAIVKRFATVIIVLLAYAAFDELSQHFSPGRHPDRLDFLADAAGIAAGTTLYLVAKLLVGTDRLG